MLVEVELTPTPTSLTPCHMVSIRLSIGIEPDTTYVRQKETGKSRFNSDRLFNKPYEALSSSLSSHRLKKKYDPASQTCAHPPQQLT
eukprot:scaffold10667_cov132-Skeletonema_marinoi.AAC.2